MTHLPLRRHAPTHDRRLALRHSVARGLFARGFFARGLFAPGALALAALLASCGGEGAACRTSGDCSGDLECQVADPPQVCGIPCGATRTCASDADCVEGNVCVDVAEPCCGPTEVGTQCQAPCVDDSVCAEGTSCSDGRCAVAACATDADCPAHFGCDASLANDVYDGCVRRACDEDLDCGDGVCVQGQCWDETGSCEEVVTVP